jgi:hypothetical protein
LVTGGRLVLVNFCKDEAGQYLGNTGGVNMFDTFNALWRRFTSEGMISSEEYLAMTFAQYYKTVDEFTQPLRDRDSPVYCPGLRLENCETRVVPCPFAVEFRLHGDAERFAREYIPTLRSWTESTFLVRSRRIERSKSARALSTATTAPTRRWYAKTLRATAWTLSTFT